MTARAKADTRWIADFRSRYTAWWPGAAPLIEQHEYASAFKSYPWPAFTETPWTPLTKPPAASRIGVVTTGGLYRTGHDLSFDGKSKALDGDCITTPGGHIELPYRWEASPAVWRGKPLHEGSNS